MLSTERTTEMSLKQVVINPGAMRTPHWPANANELAYCVSLRRSIADRPLAARTGAPEVPSTAHFGDPHKFEVEAQDPPISLAVGSARLARVQYWPALEDLSMYSLHIKEDGMREPHWHIPSPPNWATRIQ